MAHELTDRDTMFSVKETPWHKLGKVISEAPSIAEGIALAGLDWEVYADPLFTGDGTAVAACAIRRKDTNEIVGDHVGKTWKPLQNAEAFDWFAPFVDSGLASLETAGSLFSGRRVWVLAKLNRTPSEITAGDTIEKYLLLSNSHDGRLAVRCGYTPVRVVCNNTLTMAINGSNGKAASLLRLKHTKSMLDGLDQAQQLVAEADAEFEKTAELFRSLACRPITGSQFRDYVRSTLELGKDKPDEPLSTRAQNILDQVVGNMDANRQLTSDLFASFQARQEVEQVAHELIGAALLDELTSNLETGRGQPETQGAAGPTWWHAYNAITEHLTHQRGRNMETRLDQSWFGSGAQINRAALANAIQGAAV